MKAIYITVVFLFIGIAVEAQEFNGGIYGGAVTSQLDGDAYEGYYKLSFTGGAYVNRFLNKKFAMQMGLRYIQKGSRKEDHEHSIHYKCKLHYVEMPITLRYFHYEKLDLEGGLAIGYLLKQYEERDGYEIENAPEFNKLELSSIIGLNYNMSKKVSFGVHYMYSILYVRPHSASYNNMDKGQHNNLFTFTLSYQLSSWR